MDINNAIEVRNVNKFFKIQHDKPSTLKERVVSIFKRNTINKHVVLKDISLDIKKGETVALIGSNGSGKSTLLKLMTKILYPNIGTLETSGKLTSLLELGAGFHPDFTGRENIYFNASIFGLNKEQIESRINQIINFSELEEFIDNPVRTYSSGMYMRLAFSIAINVDADILLIDEILAVGDQHFQEKCFMKLKELRQTDKTIVIVSHSLSTVKELCDRAIWLYKGEFRLDGDPTYVINEYLKQQRELHAKGALKEDVLEDYTKGILYIEYPRDFERLSNLEKIRVEGWEINDYPNSKIRVFVDGEIHNGIYRIPRKDVYEAYNKKYPEIRAESLGWYIDVPFEPLCIGSHQVSVELINEQGIIINSKQAKFEKIQEVAE